MDTNSLSQCVTLWRHPVLSKQEVKGSVCLVCCLKGCLLGLLGFFSLSAVPYRLSSLQ